MRILVRNWGVALTLGIALILSAAVSAREAPIGGTILSKMDTAIMFSMSQAEWEQNVWTVVNAGIADAIRVSKGGLGMVTNPPRCDLMIVAPDYGERGGRPDFIRVTIGYMEPLASVMTDQRLQYVISRTKIEMKPEYYVTGNVERLPGGKGIFFIISENARPSTPLRN